MTRTAAGSALLVKAAAMPQSLSLGMGAARFDLTAERLFASIPARGGDAGLVGGAAAAGGPVSQWYVLRAPPAATTAHAWDLCHALITQGLGVAGATAPEFAEPDLEQRWVFGEEPRQALALAGGCPVQGEGQDDRFPRGPHPLWYRDDEYSAFDPALAQFDARDAGPVRIAHLDTGYDPGHAELPARMRLDLQRNFVDADRLQDASDTSEGLLARLGHGTGTLGILAGRRVGAAPFVQVVPIRVADGVVLFRNSAIARALDYVHGLCAAADSFVHVVTLSMGGIASQAWAEAINALYERGVVVVAAAGNNFGNLPTRHVVYPARFRRVIAACGVMADGSPYADLGLNRMAGNYGPRHKMATAIAACTPNMPWARIACPAIVDGNGAGTSSATPQVAAAAALWIASHRDAWNAYPQDWMRAEAVRCALFGSAAQGDTERLGSGRLQALEALRRAPEAADALKQQAADSTSFPILRILTGLGMAAPPPTDPRQRMLELEALQLSQDAAMETLLPDGPDAPPPSAAKLRQVAEALADDPRASRALRLAIGEAIGKSVRGASVTPTPLAEPDATRRMQVRHAMAPEVPQPTARRLRVYAFDPSVGARLETLGLNEAVIDVPWETLAPGPVGEYVEVVDVDPASRACYAPVNLEDPALLVRDGLRPSEADPRFHQQMVYAVAMKTIGHFERALGRVALWAPRWVDTPAGGLEQFVPRLRIYPHALRAANAFYSPDKKALLFGYFEAAAQEAGDNLPEGLVFTCLSHDVVAHETTHALLDGLHRRFREPTNPDVFAFHEAFADLVALFQHFTVPEALRDQIARTRGDLGRKSLLGELARQFGEALQGHGALRDFIGEFKTQHGQKVWAARPPRRTDYTAATEAHERGAVLVAAVFDAFLQIYRRRGTDLVRLATGGTGVLPQGEIPEALVARLAAEASKTARHFLDMCIRALDYCPPVDITFGEYLRALVTADRDLVPDDPLGYRVALVSAFRDRGIYPLNVRHLSVDSVVWEPPPQPLSNIRHVLQRMSLRWNLAANREAVHHASRRNAAIFRTWLTSREQVPDDELDSLGLFRAGGPMVVGGQPGELRNIEVHSVRPARRVGPDGQLQADLVIELTQTWRPNGQPNARCRGGCTLLIDLESGNVRYLVRKRVAHKDQVGAQLAFAAKASEGSLRTNYFDTAGRSLEPFAMLHAHR